MKFLLIFLKKLSVVKKGTFSHEEGKMVFVLFRLCVSISQRMVSAVFRQNDFFLQM